MKYDIIPVNIVPDHRADLNKAILSYVKGEIPASYDKKQQIFNLYTGDGGLHGFKPSDFQNFSEFISAKREADMGQFFTDPSVAKEIIEILGIESTAKMLDPTCGSGVFCNFLEQEENFTGVEISPDVCSVAAFLYPKANIINKSILEHSFEEKFDYVVANPPFNFNFDGVRSQLKIIMDSAKWLKPYGFLVIIVPSNYLEDVLFYSGHIDFINNSFRHIGTIETSHAFKAYNLQYKTKALFFQLADCPESIGSTERFSNGFSLSADIQGKITELKSERKKWLLSAISSIIKKPNDFSFKDGSAFSDDGFLFRLKKYLYEVKVHAPDKYEKALQILADFKSQKKPSNMELEEWQKVKLTPNKILWRIKSLYRKHARKKKGGRYCTEHHPLQFVPLEDITPSEEILSFLKSFSFNNEKEKGLYLLPHQITDCSRQLMKPYGVLNWEQGTGKTVGAYAMMSYRKVKIKVIVAPAKVIRGMWSNFFNANGENYVEIRKPSDISLKTPIWIVSYSFLSMKRNRPLLKKMKKLLRSARNDYMLVLDEIHKIKNPYSQVFKSVKATFKNAKYKLGMTGTIVWNSACELYGVLDFLYNNSLVDNCPCVYKQTKDGALKEAYNDRRGLKFNAYSGYVQFKRCFSPEKKTVFGINKKHQDVYNYEAFIRLITPVSSIRAFKEVAGDKYVIKHMLINPVQEERALFDKIIFDNFELIRDYFQDTGNTRKEAGLKILRVLTLLLRAASHPESFKEFEGQVSTKILKIKNIVKNTSSHVAIGCTRKKTAGYYHQMFKKWFPERKAFLITGEVSIENRIKILKELESSPGAILVCTQQSLEEGLNIGFVSHAIVESMNWNLPKMSQWFFRFIRLNSEEQTTVYFVNYDKSIENNLFALLMAKEAIAKIVKMQNEDIFTAQGFDVSILNHILERVKCDNGKMGVRWGNQEFH